MRIPPALEGVPTPFRLYYVEGTDCVNAVLIDAVVDGLLC